MSENKIKINPGQKESALTDLIEISFIELLKFNKTHKDYNDKLHKWLTVLANPSGKEIGN